MTEDKNNPTGMNMESDKSFAVFESTMDKFFQTAHVNSVYGAPVKHGDTTIIPTAEVIAYSGFGVGGGGGSGPEGTGGGSGGGGGGSALSRPVAVIVAGPEGVEVKTVLDLTKIALAALTAWGFMGAMAMRMMRKPKLR